jgi:hypothetical protein
VKARLSEAREAGVRTGSLPIVVWGCAIVVFAVCGAIFAGLDVLPTLLSAAAGTGAILWGFAGAWSGRRDARARREREAEVVLDLSLPTVVAVFGFTMAMAGVAAAGPGFFWPGVAIFGLGALALLGESRERRSVQSRAREVLAPPPEGAASEAPVERVA